MHSQRGFTLPELLISIILLLILTAMAVPSFSHYLAHKRQQSYLYALKQTLEMAHLYALHHQVTVKVCPSQNRQTCSINWVEGGIVLSDQHIIGTFPALPTGQSLTVLLFPDHPWVQFLAQGLATQSSGSFTVYDSVTTQTKTLTLSNTGRLRITAS